MYKRPKKPLRRVKPGDLIRAEHVNLIAQEMERDESGWRELQTPYGTYRAKPPGGWYDWEWGQLDEKLDGEEPGVARVFSVWRYDNGAWSDSGEDLDVYPGYDTYVFKEVFGPKHPGRAVRGKDGRYYFIPRYEIWRFELKVDLDQWVVVPVDACKKDYDPSANSGWGGYVIDVNTQFKVADWRRVGYFGVAGAEGAAEIHYCDGPDPNDKGVILGVICDLECPSECVCGTTDPNAVIECS